MTCFDLLQHYVDSSLPNDLVCPSVVSELHGNASPGSLSMCTFLITLMQRGEVPQIKVHSKMRRASQGVIK